MHIHYHRIQEIKADGTVEDKMLSEFKTFKFSELTEETQKKAVESFQSNVDLIHDEWSEFIQEDFKSQLSVVGVEVSVDDMFYSVAGCQGDGACFKGGFTSDIKLKDDLKGDFGEEDSKKLREWHKELKAIAGQNLIHGSITLTPSNYTHEKIMDVEFEVLDSDGEVVDEEDCDYEDIYASLLSLYRKMAVDLYKTLVKQYDYMQTEEFVKNEIECNYENAEFLKDGRYCYAG